MLVPSAANVSRSSRVMPLVTSARVWPNGHRISSVKAWKSIDGLDLLDAADDAAEDEVAQRGVSGAENADGPR